MNGIPEVRKGMMWPPRIWPYLSKLVLLDVLRGGSRRFTPKAFPANSHGADNLCFRIKEHDA